MGTQYSREHLPPRIGDMSVQMDEDEPPRVAVDQVNDVGVDKTDKDFDMEPMSVPFFVCWCQHTSYCIGGLKDLMTTKLGTATARLSLSHRECN